MAEGKVKIRFDPEADIIYMLVREGPIKDTIEAAEDFFVEIAEDGSVAGVEIWRAKEHILGNLAEHIKTIIKRAE